MTSCTSVDLPEPETPVTATIMSSGIVDVDVLQVVRLRAQERGRRAWDSTLRRLLTYARSCRSPRRYCAVSDVAAVGDQLLVGAFEDDAAAVLARARAQVDDVVGRAHHVRIVLHHHDRVAEIAQFCRIRISRAVSRLCRPMEGSSRT